jgi:hypothetical protein
MTLQQKNYDPALSQGAANTLVCPQTISDSTNQAFAVGPNGATTPIFNVDASASTAVVGVNIAGTATGTPCVLSAIGSATNESLDIKPKGAGTTRLYGHKRHMVSGSGATVTLTADQSGAAVLFDRAAGIVFTLPAAVAGLCFDFFVSVTITSGAAKVITSTGTELLVGTLLNTNTSSSDAVANWKALVASSYVAVSMNGSTTGGIKGDWLRFTCLNSTTWNVSGMTLATGTVATPFATS